MGPDIDRLPPEVERNPRMDIKVRDRVMTPRIGKPVEVQALWLGPFVDRVVLARISNS